ncbi:ribosomal subunit interface protein [Quadrisphaera granulorum]|uniref:Ribosome hibernation promoting factor n=1 Tax=Quadrisphaera granulorum TaxID=317664 RepID=A0A316AD48_9ACTN|nr:ribosome-associated translation inhibitor RaiA [Quadrisphaera granulorum]PWJ54814.1 ribosomal subunit interface protein [Quadrisphaera granulorum]SZE95760.1 ribosomal subunit interface protein [Quadrisphaera granulorum]
MEIVVTARHTEVPGRFRRHLDEKLAKVEQLAPKVQRIEVAVSHEANKRQSERCERIELTLRGPGPVVRAEACASDAYAALDMATTKLMERLRRASDRKKVHKQAHGGNHARGSAEPALPVPEAVLAPLTAAAPAAPVVTEEPPPTPDDHVHRGDAQQVGDGEWVLGESPVVIRDKVHPATPMTLEAALEQMELVGHDFYLFVDADTGRPSVVYRRRGWSYGVLRLAGEGEAADDGTVSDAQQDGTSAERREPVGAGSR